MSDKWPRLGRLGAACGALALLGLAAPANAEGGKPTVIRVEITETHDRLGPDPRPDIVRAHTFVVTLSNKNQVQENEVITKGGRRMQAGIVKTVDNDATIGNANGRVVWHVLGPHKLQRIAQGGHFIFIWDIDIDESNGCHLDAKYLKQAGFENVMMKRADTGELTPFSLPRLMSASCSIQ
jgi:hypothetical protein